MKGRSMVMTTIPVAVVVVIIVASSAVVSTAFTTSRSYTTTGFLTRSTSRHEFSTSLVSSSTTTTTTTTGTTLFAAGRGTGSPKRLNGNVDGPLYVNDKCINCAACAMFAPSSFQRNDQELAHNVYRQPQTDKEIEQARAALSACPVAAIRLETTAYRSHNNLPPMTPNEVNLTQQLAISPKFNGRPVPFPRPLNNCNGDDSNVSGSTDGNVVWFVGHHNEKSFGATPYIFYSQQDDKWIMIDTPRYSKSAVDAIEGLTGGRPVDILILSHVDDTAGHVDWKQQYPNLQRIFHSGDLGKHNWIGDTTLEHVEVLLLDPSSTTSSSSSSSSSTTTLSLSSNDSLLSPPVLPAYDIYGNSLTTQQDTSSKQVVIYHTPGHSPGSICVLFRPSSSSSSLLPTTTTTSTTNVKGTDNDNDDDDGQYGGAVLFTGDTYAYRLSDDHMTGLPMYGNDRQKQAEVLPKLLQLDWMWLAPGHGHYFDYSTIPTKAKRMEQQRIDMNVAIDELIRY